MKFKTSIDYIYGLFLAVILVLLLLDLGSYGLAETSEARYAEIGREMFLSGDYLNPKLLEIFHFHKPPITYYLTALGYKLFGITEFGARFFLQVAILLQLLFVYGISNLLFQNKRISLLSGVIYFLMPLVLISSRNLTTDAYLTTFILASIYCWQYYTQKGTLSFLYLFYSAIGLALLTKGPVALVFITVYIVTYKLVFKTKTRLSMHAVLGICICIAIGASWYILVMIENPKLWTYFVEKQLLSRINSDSFNRGKPFWYYIPILIGLLLPWLIGSLFNFRLKLKALAKLGKEEQVLFYSSLVLLLIFSLFKTKLILYILPVFWMLALIIATRLYTSTSKTRKYINGTYLILLGVILVSILGCWYFKPVFIKIPITTSLLAFSVILIVCAFFYVIQIHDVLKTAFLAALFNLVLLVISPSILKNNSALINSTKELTRFINLKSDGADKTIVIDDYLLSSIPFYTGEYPITLKNKHNTTAREVQFQNDSQWQENLWDEKDSLTLLKLTALAKKKNTYLLARKKRGLSKPISHLAELFKNKKVSSKWIMYYND